MPGDSTTATPVTRATPRRRPACRLYVVHPPEQAGPIPLDDLAGGKVTLGRAGGESGPHAIGLDDPTISRRHFAVSWDPSIWRHVGEDLGSKNGTWIDGARLVSTTRVLSDGAVIRLGGMVLVCETGAPLAPDAPAVDREAVPGESAAVRALRARLAAVAPGPAPVLLLGETGTGKEHIAAEVHRLSGRRGPFLAVNCAELNLELIESQLYGHGRGAFTSAVKDSPGLFRSADTGTLLLDEIGELPLALQPKLLRVLQEREVLPVGDDTAVTVDVRVVAATNSDLPARVNDGTFRRDLHARLSLQHVAVPALAARKVDLLPWVVRLHRRWQAERHNAIRPLRFDADAAEAILLADWPDNLRGLDRLVHQLGTSGEMFTLAAVAPHLTAPAAPPAAPAPAAADPRPAPPTREELAAALEAAGGSVRAVAKKFGRDRKQIYRWLRDRGLR